MVQFIDDHRAWLGVEPICAVLPIAPSTYHRHRHQRTDPTRRSARAQRDDRHLLRRAATTCLWVRLPAYSDRGLFDLAL